ncbi:MAG: GTPase (G3E family) [Clostridiales bacterium]|nr:GTPase (G3E family) [Clostridiales bacterium]
MTKAKAKYMVTSGFLGAGKTTAMIAFAKSINRRYGKAAILANDLGASNIVDADFTATTDILTTQISGNCICYQHENLVDKLNQLVSQGATIIMSDIPGCGIGALDHVYIQLEERRPGEFELMPFTCIVDPLRLRMIMPEAAELNLPPEMRFLLEAQMAEADLIALNKIDLMSREQIEKSVAFIQSSFPETKLLTMSALTGEGVDEVVDYLMQNRSAAKHKDIGYGSEAFIAAESLLSWYNRRVFLEEMDDRAVDFNAVVSDVFEEIREGLKDKKSNVPHLKAFASGEGDDFIKASLIGVDYETEYARRLAKPYSAISLIINARAAADSQDMANIVDDALEAVSEKHNLKIRTFFVESFGMMEEGRGNGGRASRYE